MPRALERVGTSLGVGMVPQAQPEPPIPVLELGSGWRPGGCDKPDVALGALGILYSSLKMFSP